MNRRLLILALLVGVGWPAAPAVTRFAHAADTPTIVRLAYVNPHSPSNPPTGTNAFWQRLRELGYIEGQNLILETRWANDMTDRLPELVADVVARKPDVLVTWGGVAAIAAKNATHTVPIVAVGIPLDSGVAESLAQPGGNLTGLSLGWSNIAGKWLELLKETVPRLSTLAVIANPNNPLNRSLTKELQASSASLRLKLVVIEVREQQALGRAFEQARRQAQAALVLPDSVLNADRPRLVALAAKHRLPSMYSTRATVAGGGLIAYGPSFAVQWRRAADYVDKILKGAKPAELPIEEPIQFELAVNLGTAKALKLNIPESVLLRADEVVR